MNVSSVTSSAAGALAATPAATTTAAATTNPATATPDSFTNPSSILNQTDFLQLLVAQIQYQDPLNPQSDTEMAAQMAQFATLQQATQSTGSLAMMQANSLIGSTVTVQIDANNSATGVVTGVDLSSGTPEITINGANYNLSQVTSVTPTTVSATSSAASAATTNSGSANTASATTGSTNSSGTSPSNSNSQASQ